MTFDTKLRIYLSGGLGNQIFQLYAGLHIAAVREQIPVVDITSVAKSHSKFNITSFNIPFTVVSNPLQGKLSNKFPQISHFQNWKHNQSKRHLVDQGFTNNLAQCQTSHFTGMSGYFQDLRYFDKRVNFKLTLAKNSRNYLEFKEGLSEKSYLSVHIRRGDFLGQADSHGCLSAEWYLNAIREILNRDKSINQILYFSDDENWVEDKIKGKLNLEIRETVIGPDSLDDPAESWSLMRASRHLLCSNSTFSITAAICSTAEITLPSPLTRNGNFKNISMTLPKKWNSQPTIWET